MQSPAATPSGRGSPFLMGLGSFVIGLLLVDNVLQYQYTKEAEDKIAQLAKEEQEQRQALLEEWKEKPSLFSAKAVIEYKMGGTMGLRGVDVGDVMEVIQEHVGPNKGYYLCRTRDSLTGEVSAVGWYPRSFMEKVDSSQQPAEKSKFLGLF